MTFAVLFNYGYEFLSLCIYCGYNLKFTTYD